MSEEKKEISLKEIKRKAEEEKKKIDAKARQERAKINKKVLEIQKKIFEKRFSDIIKLLSENEDGISNELHNYLKLVIENYECISENDLIKMKNYIINNFVPKEIKKD